MRSLCRRPLSSSLTSHFLSLHCKCSNGHLFEASTHIPSASFWLEKSSFLLSWREEQRSERTMRDGEGVTGASFFSSSASSPGRRSCRFHCQSLSLFRTERTKKKEKQKYTRVRRKTGSKQTSMRSKPLPPVFSFPATAPRGKPAFLFSHFFFLERGPANNK